MQLLISDANILIDLEEGHLIELMFQLPFQFCIPDILFVEELEEEHNHLPALGLELMELSSETMIHAMELIPRYAKTSRNDCFALALAANKQCPLLTGDKALKEAAEKEAVIVHGTIWIIRMMITHDLISVEQAQHAFDMMRDAGRRLPWRIAEAILEELRDSSL